MKKENELNSNCDEIVHDITHYLKVIGHLAYEGRNKEICDAVENLNGKLRSGNIYEYSNIKVLNMILSEYCEKAKKLKIDFDIYIEPGCTLGNINDLDIVAMVGNLLDNSFLAASKVEKNTSVYLRIFMQKNGEICIIKVVNNFVKELKRVEDKLISTKNEKGKHGIGITSVSKIAEKYNGYFEYYVEKEKFNAVLVLKI